MTSSGVNSVQRLLPSLNHLHLHRVQILPGSAPPNRPSQHRPSLQQPHMTDSSPLTADKVIMARQHSFKTSTRDHSLPSTSRREHHCHHRQQQQRLAAESLCERSVKRKMRCWEIKKKKRQCKGVSEEMEKQQEVEGCRAAPCACWCSLLGKRRTIHFDFVLIITLD